MFARVLEFSPDLVGRSLASALPLALKIDGEDVTVVAQATKTGFLFVLHRDTGEPVFPVEELPVPTSDVIGEESWPTSPSPPFRLRWHPWPLVQTMPLALLPGTEASAASL